MLKEPNAPKAVAARVSPLRKLHMAAMNWARPPTRNTAVRANRMSVGGNQRARTALIVKVPVAKDTSPQGAASATLALVSASVCSISPPDTSDLIGPAGVQRSTGVAMADLLPACPSSCHL